MPSYSIAAAREQLAELVEKARQGEIVTITRDGEPIAELAPARAGKGNNPKVKLIDEIAERARLRGPLDRSAVEILREMRDEAP